MWASAHIASKSAIFALATITFLTPPSFVMGHGYLDTPRSRNYLAHEEGPSCSGAGCPPAEYCHHCLNLNNDVCGKFGERSYDGVDWLDKNGNPMPWVSQGVYSEGDEIIVRSYLDTHHNGHMEIRACNKGNACTAADFEEPGSELIFVRDNVLDPAGIAMPADEFYPERGMYAGGQGGGIKSFEFVYRLPEGMYGDEILLQWLYITANSCSPPGYEEYFARHPELPSSYWTPGVDTCTPPYPNDGARGTTWPERFYNCAEISITQSGTSSPTVSPKPTPAPTTASPTVSINPTLPPVTTPSCLAEWADCTYNWSGCCDGLQCTQVNQAGLGTCLADTCTDEGPTPPPTNMPTPPVTFPPTPPPTVPAPTNPPTPLPTNPPTLPTPTPDPTSNPTNQPTPVSPPTTPSPIGTAFPAVESDKVRVNQVGYLRFASKVAVIVDSSSSPLQWQVQDSVGAVVLAGDSIPFGFDDASGDDVHQADFSALVELGMYKLVVDGIGASLEFAVAPSLYADLPHEAMNYFYFHRMGPDAILGEHLIDERYSRAALHPADGAVPAYPGWCETCEDFDLLGSWADAGDFGVYTVNHAISAWTLLNLHELFPEAFVDGTLNIPESGNLIPDVLDEVNYGSRFVRGMLPSDGGLASHKAHNHVWSAFTITIEAENQSNAIGTRSAMGSSTPATYAVARVNAQLARMYSAAPGDNQSHASVLWDAAVDAWGRADGTSKTYNAAEASPGPALGGGDYPDGAISDDRYAAACEMYLTAYALGDSSAVKVYKSAMMQSSHFKSMGQWDWASVAGAGTLSLYAVDSDLSAGDKASIEANIISFADQIKASIDSEGYPSNLAFPSEYSQYPWGSNSFIMNRMIALAYAFEISQNDSYLKYLLRSMDYIMGTNAMDISYVTGYGEKAETDTHDRWAWTIGQDAFWPKGWLSGGPNNELINDYETPGGVAAAKSYAGPGTAPHAWGSKENTINWNAPLAWVAWYIENKAVPVLGGCDGNCPPTAQSLSNIKVQMDSSVSLTLSASDYDGTIASWEVTDPSLGSLSGDAPNLIYTPNAGALGTDTFTFRVIDDSGDASNYASVTILVRDCNLIDVFNVPSTYAAFQGSYNYVHVSEDGPSLSNLKTPAHNVQWQDPGLYQFSLELEIEPYYADLTQCMTVQDFSGAEASFTLSGCSVNGIDGEYFITQQDGNEIWVEKNNLWAIVFTNDANYTPQFCRGDGTPSPTSQVTPSPTQPPVNVNPPPSPPPSPPPTPAPTPPVGADTATTTRYWDCSGGACGCSFVRTGFGDNEPVHCHSNALFAAPSDNPFGASYYGAAAISEALGGGNWMSSGCGKCWKVTGYSDITASWTTLVLKGTNFCPPSNDACADNKVHFDIAAPGFDVTEYSQSNTCSEREPEEAAGFASCGRWMIDSQDPNVNCNCDAFNDPVLKAGCSNFYNLKWDNPQVEYEEVACPEELAQLHCEHPYATESDMPETCSNNVFTASPPTFLPTNAPSPKPTPKPTAPAPPTNPPTPEIAPKPTTPPPTPKPTAPAPPTNPPTPEMTPKPTTAPTPKPTAPPTDPPTPQPTPKPTTAPPTNPPTPPPTIAATPNPTPPPTSGGTYCCGDRNTGYQQCNSGSWCNESAGNCKKCGGIMTTVPLQRTGCCSWGGDCSSQDPSSNPGCHYLQSDCEGSCGGTWQAF